eukprot:2797120-Alexandrium_andersonii.AAC.1
MAQLRCVPSLGKRLEVSARLRNVAASCVCKTKHATSERAGSNCRLATQLRRQRHARMWGICWT